MTFLLPLPSCFVLSPYKLSWYGIRHLYYVCLFWLIYWITLAFEADSLLFQLVERLQKTSTRNLRLLATSACSPRRSARHVCLLATRTCSPLRSARQVRLLTTCHIPIVNTQTTSACRICRVLLWDTPKQSFNSSLLNGGEFWFSTLPHFVLQVPRST